ncbi:MAG: type I pullulanase [Bacteroidota bacterium]|nr:type I pullulanase [Odoribacter sp.]MDP3643718.1 type I pullulanase [Bacteroidota bacterium]
MRDWRFNSNDFNSYPGYSGDDLGVYWSKERTTIRIWAPTAIQVELRIYRQGQGGSAIRIDLFEKAESGTWIIRLNGNLEGYYYTIRINDGNWLNETPGPEVRAVGLNGHRGLIFNPEKTNPEGWEMDTRIESVNATETIIYELHVRDFSISPTSGMQNKGKYLAFTETGTISPQGLKTGIDHLVELGITHVHLLPVYDFATVDEQAPDKSYNWGYDPQNFNSPEGSYSTNPNNISRILELKMLVQSLHRAGIGVIFDVVYNHTFYTRRSPFNQTVPGYYYRQKSNGTFSNASGCGNEVATERNMVRKYIIDSLRYWATEFHADGFRFDLMGIYDLETMNLIRTNMDSISPSILIYGEGWAADKSPMEETWRAVKTNVSHLFRIAVFNDDFRNGIKGNSFNSQSKGFVSGQTIQEENIKFGIAGACFHPQIVYGYVEHSKSPWATEPWQCINYASCHDNYTLYDKLALSCPESSEDELNSMVMLAGALILTSQGIPFLHAGIEMNRTKNGDFNSYKSPDSINQIDWSRKSTSHQIFRYYQSLIDLRKKHPAFRMKSAYQIRNHLVFSSDYHPGVASYVLVNHANEDEWRTILLVFNGNPDAITFKLMEHIPWRIVARDTKINLDSTEFVSGTEIRVSGISMLMLVED